MLRELLWRHEMPDARLPILLARSQQAFRQYHSVSVLVEVKSTHADASLERLCRQHRVRMGMHMHVADCRPARVTPAQARELVQHPDVIRLHLDRPVYALLDIAVPSVGVPAAWEIGLDGRGICAAVVDTGIYPHADLMSGTRDQSRITAFHDVINRRSTPYDDNGHGTHVAGIIAGNGYSSGGRYRGVAPETELVGVKALDANGSGSLSGLLAAFQWVIENRQRYGIRVLNLSLGAQALLPSSDDPLCRAAERAWQAGIVVCAAAGNSGPEFGTVSTPGITPRVITVGAFDDHRTVNPADDTLAIFSSRGPTPEGLNKPDLLCPGKDIVSLRAPRSLLSRAYPSRNDPYLTLSGTSMATPVCSGAAVLLLQQNGNRTPDQVKRLLLSGSVSMGLTRNEQGAGAFRSKGLWNT